MLQVQWSRNQCSALRNVQRYVFKNAGLAQIALASGRKTLASKQACDFSCEPEREDYCVAPESSGLVRRHAL